MANFRYREQVDYLYSVSVGVVIQVLALTGTLGPVLWPSPSPPNLAIFYSLFNPSPPVKTGSGRFCGNLKVNFSWSSQKYKNRLVELRYSESVSSLLNRLLLRTCFVPFRVTMLNCRIPQSKKGCQYCQWSTNIWRWSTTSVQSEVVMARMAASTMIVMEFQLELNNELQSREWFRGVTMDSELRLPLAGTTWQNTLSI